MEKPKEKLEIILGPDHLQRLFGLKGAFGRLVGKLAYRLLALDKANEVRFRYPNDYGPDFAARTLEDVGITYNIPTEELANIPAEGAFITVSNHHFGSVDGLLLSAVLGKIRTDYKLLTNNLLALIPNLGESFLPVDNISASAQGQNIAGIRMAINHLASGGGLGLFPAGEVGTYQKKEKRTAVGPKPVVEDKPWPENISKLIQRSAVPVVPIYFDGTNSRLFHFIGKIHPRLRTVWLVRELFNKKGTHVEVRIGQPIQPAEIATYDIPSLGRYLRNRVYALEAEVQTALQTPTQVYSTPVTAPVPPEELCAEMEGLKDKILFETGGYRCFLVKASEAPLALKELARLREETFRAVGEGTGEAIDTDTYDTYYHHLILWNIEDRQIAGAYRIGYGPELMARPEKIDAFYTASLFRFAPDSGPLLETCMELGRTIVIGKYQKDVLPLKCLLAGISIASCKYPQIKYFLGPVSISNDYPDFFKSLTAHFFETRYPFPEGEKVALPTHPLPKNFLRVNPDQLLHGIQTIDQFDRLLAAMSGGKYRLPVLVRKYFSCSAHLVCFNVDPLFNNSLDGLILLRLSEFPKNTFRALVRSLPEEVSDSTSRSIYGIPFSEI